MGHTSGSRSSSFRAELLIVGGALGLALTCVAPSLGAAPRGPLVVVVSNDPDTPFVRRLAAELSLFGYRVELAQRDESDDELSDLLARHRGAALIAVDQHRQTAEVIVGEPAGAGPFRHERERLDPRRQADTNAAVLAERFRARLTELGIAPVEDAPTVAPTEVPAAAEPLPRLWLAAGAGASSGGLGPMADFEIELRVFPRTWLSASLFGRFSPIGARVSGREGEADVRLFGAGVLIDAYPLRNERSDLLFKVGLGAMLLNATVAGSATAPFQGRDDALLVPAGVFESGAAWKISPRASLELRAFVGVCSPRVAVRLAGRRAADFGQPFVGVSLGGAIGVF